MLCLFLLLLSANASGQDTARAKHKYPYDDDTLKMVKLSAMFNKHKILEFETGEDAIIYVDESNMRQQAAKDTSNDWAYLKQAGRSVLELLDSSYKSADTTFIYAYNSHLEYFILLQLITGSATVYDRKAKVFASIIFHWLKRVLSTADRVFYFPDKRFFFRVRELSGILPNEFMELE